MEILEAFTTLLKDDVSGPFVLVAVGIIALYFLLCLFSLIRDAASTLEKMQATDSVINKGEWKAFVTRIENSKSFEENNPFEYAFATLLIHLGRPESKTEAKEIYLGRDPDWYINDSVVRSAGFRIAKYYRVKQNLYLTAIFFTFAGILLALLTMIDTFNQDNPKALYDGIGPFLGSVSIKFVASIAGIFAMLIYGWFLGKKEELIDLGLTSLQQKLKQTFQGKFDISVDAQMDENAKTFISALKHQETAASSLRTSVTELGNVEFAKDITEIKDEVKQTKKSIEDLTIATRLDRIATAIERQKDNTETVAKDD